MIITKLQGGLGNQLFQWAFGLYISKKYNVPLFLDTSFYEIARSEITPRAFSLNKFSNLNYQILDKIINDKQTLLFSENAVVGVNLPYDNNYNYYIDGYWQYHKHLTEIKDLIANDLKPNTPFLNKFAEYNGQNNTSLHIRRTDYVSSNGYHPVQTIEYYEEAINKIGDYEKLLIFSDDIEWCKENLKFDRMVFMEGHDDVEDLWLMSLCKNNIIANSSFSWWGAWLNENENKKVIAPKNWLGGQKGGLLNNLIPPSWDIL